MDYTLLQLIAWVPGRFDSVKFENSLFGCFNLVALENNEIVGFISVSTEGYINRLFTKSTFQHRGIATRLLDEAEKWAISIGIDCFTLDSSITAKGFYLKRGFVEEGKSIIKRNNIGLDAILMKKPLRR